MSPEAPTGRWTVVTLLLAVQIFANIDRQILNVVVEPVKLEFGLSDSVMGLLTGAAFSVFYYRAGKMVSADSVNNAKEHLLVRKLLDAGVSPTPEQAADTAFDLATLIKT